MYPYLRPGDLIVTRKVRNVQLNDVVVYRDPVAGIIAHRIVAIADHGYYTKGDNNPVRDPGTLEINQMMTKIWFRLPWFGKPRNLVNKILGK